MPLPQWLRALLPKTPSPTPSTPAPATDAEILAASTAAYEHARANWQPSEDVIDTGVRMHIAAHDPEFPAKREAAVAAITAAIDAVAQAHGFTKKPRSWAKSGDLGTVSIHLQRSRYGFDCHIDLGFQPLAGGLSTSGPWALDDYVALARFYPPHPSESGAAAPTEQGAITYLDVHEHPDGLAIPMTVLSEQALPWLTAHLTNPAAPNQPFLQGTAPLG